MPHNTALIVTIAAGLGLAFVFGLIATRLRLPPLVGYLLAGVAVGPYTPGFVADTGLAQQLAEIGVILLMFGVGIHFSVGDLLAVRRIALPGAAVQITLATALGAAVAHLWGWSWGSGIVFGLCLSVASTVVLLRALEDRGLLDSVDGRISVGWLVVEDLVTVLVLVMLPALAVPLGGTAPPSGESLLVDARTHARQGGRVRRFSCSWSAAGRALAAGAGGANGLTRALHPLGARHRPRHRRRRLGALRRVVRAGRVLRRHGGQRIGPEPRGGGRRAADAGRLLGALLRGGRHAVRPRHPAAASRCRCSRWC